MSLEWDFNASIIATPFDQWGAIRAATSTSVRWNDGQRIEETPDPGNTLQTWIQSDIRYLVHAVAATWLAFKSRWPDGYYSEDDHPAGGNMFSEPTL
jgi:hypothetical protein